MESLVLVRIGYAMLDRMLTTMRRSALSNATNYILLTAVKLQ